MAGKLFHLLVAKAVVPHSVEPGQNVDPGQRCHAKRGKRNKSGQFTKPDCHLGNSLLQITLFLYVLVLFLSSLSPLSWHQG